MKKTLLLFTALVSFYGCKQATTNTTEPATEQSTTANTNRFGASVEEGEAIAPTELVKQVAGQDSIQATVAAEVVESCQAKGCWMDVKLADGNSMKVTFRDYGFFLPIEDLKGRTAVFTGTAKQELISVADQQHYAKDAGKTDAEVALITQPKQELRFVADGVILK